MRWMDPRDVWLLRSSWSLMVGACIAGQAHGYSFVNLASAYASFVAGRAES